MLVAEVFRLAPGKSIRAGHADVHFGDAVTVGPAQVLALVPGTSAIRAYPIVAGCFAALARGGPLGFVLLSLPAVFAAAAHRYPRR